MRNESLPRSAAAGGAIPDEGISEPSFIFDHIQKTGGSAFKGALEQIFGVENVSPAISGRPELWAAHNYSKYRVITGHFHSPIPMERGATGRVRITILRDPIDRAISEYYYYRNDVKRVEWNKLAILAKDHELYSYVKLLAECRDPSISNLYVRRLASQISRRLDSDRQILSLAKEALARYDFVGIQEHFVDSVDLFCCRFALPPVPSITRVNVTSSRLRPDEVDQKTRTMLEELYQFALRNFEQQKRAIFHRSAGVGSLKSTPEDLDEWWLRKVSTAPDSFGDQSVEICEGSVTGAQSGTNVLSSGEQARLSLIIAAHVNVAELTVGVEISDELGEIVFGTNTFLMRECRPVQQGQSYDVGFAFPANLKHGRYFVGASLHTGATHEDCCYHWRDRVTTFDIVDDAASVFVGYCRLHPTVEWKSARTALKDVRRSNALWRPWRGSFKRR